MAHSLLTSTPPTQHPSSPQKHDRTLSGLLGKRPVVPGLTESAMEQHDISVVGGLVHGGGDTISRYFSTPQPSLKEVRGVGVLLGYGGGVADLSRGLPATWSAPLLLNPSPLHPLLPPDRAGVERPGSGQRPAQDNQRREQRRPRPADLPG